MTDTTTFIPVRESGSLLSIGAFWRANAGRDRGFSIIVGEPNASRAAQMVQEALERFAALPKEEQQELLSEGIPKQLSEVSEILWSTAADGQFHPERLGPEDISYVLVAGMTNIAILEACGCLTPDEYNGMNYVHAYAERPSTTRVVTGLAPGGGKTIPFHRGYTR